MIKKTDFGGEIQSAIDITTDALRPWMLEALGAWPPGRRGEARPADPSYLIGILLDYWRDTFFPLLGGEGQTLVHEFRHTRNRWAHREPFEYFDAIRALDTCRRLLILIESSDQSELHRSLNQLIGNRNPESKAPARDRKPRPSEIPGMAPTLSPDAVDAFVESIDSYGSGEVVPLVSAASGRSKAQVLLLFQDPAPLVVRDPPNPTVLSPAAPTSAGEVLRSSMDEAGLSPDEVLLWCAYPWVQEGLNRIPKEGLEKGRTHLVELLSLLPDLRVVLSFGSAAHDCWRQVSRSGSDCADRIRHIETFPVSRHGQGQVEAALKEAAAHLPGPT